MQQNEFNVHNYDDHACYHKRSYHNNFTYLTTECVTFKNACVDGSGCGGGVRGGVDGDGNENVVKKR